MKETAVILAAGGSGARYGKSKLWEMAEEKYVWQYALDAIVKEFNSTQIYMVVPEKEYVDYKSILDSIYAGLCIEVVKGGATRAESVQNALKIIPEKFERVLIQDAARPYLSARLLTETIDYCKTHHCGVIAGARVTDTIKQMDAIEDVARTLNRDELAAIQTPQVFNRAKLIEGYRLCTEQGIIPTDDATAYEFTGEKVHVYLHDDINAKITYPHDFEQFCAHLSKQQRPIDYTAVLKEPQKYNIIFLVSILIYTFAFLICMNYIPLGGHYKGISLCVMLVFGIGNLLFAPLIFRIIWFILLAISINVY